MGRPMFLIKYWRAESNPLTDASVYHQTACGNHTFNPESNGNAAASNIHFSKPFIIMAAKNPHIETHDCSPRKQ